MMHSARRFVEMDPHIVIILLGKRTILFSCCDEILHLLEQHPVLRDVTLTRAQEPLRMLDNVAWSGG